LRDGVNLNATLYRPQAQREPLPCVFTLTPYISDNYHPRGTYFAAHGYVFLIIDVRGRGNSEGTQNLFLQDAHDGYDIVEWLAKQPYCNGKVAMWGGSYAGANQWSTAAERPPHLVTIVPAASGLAGVDFPLQGNIWPTYWLQWFTLVSGRTSQATIFADDAFWTEQFRQHFIHHRPYLDLDKSVGNPTPLFRTWLAHPQVDAYWDAQSPTTPQYAAIDVPALTITGQYDGGQLGALEYYRRHLVATTPVSRAKHFVIIGPWDHAQTRTPTDEVGGLKLGAASVLDLNDLHRQWYDWTMKGGPRPAFLQKRVAYYVTGTEAWRYADSLEAITSSTRALHLSSQAGHANDVAHSGRLQEQVSDTPPDQYIYDPLDVSMADLQASLDLGSLIEQREVLLSAGKKLIYHSEPFSEETVVSGVFRLNAWMALDQPDTDFEASIYQIAPDGGSVLLTTSQLRARYRESFRREQLVRKGEVLEYRFAGFPFVARQLVKGSRLRLVLGPVNSIYFQKNYNSGGEVAKESAKDARTVTVRLYHDAQHPSALYVPIGVN
jgi:putative CocE/NonD family hydrolase